MRDEIIGLIALCFSVPASVVYYKKVMGGNTKHDRFVNKAKRNGCVTTGVSVDTEYLSGDPDAKSLQGRSGALAVKYQYQVEGITYYKRIHFHDAGSINIKYPRTIEIYYEKSKPKKAVSPVEFSAANRRQSGCLGAVGIWIVITGILVNVLKWLFSGVI